MTNKRLSQRGMDRLRADLKSSAPDTPSPHIAPKLLEDYAQELLSENKMEELDLHLTTCEICLATVERIQAVLASYNAGGGDVLRARISQEIASLSTQLGVDTTQEDEAASVGASLGDYLASIFSLQSTLFSPPAWAAGSREPNVYSSHGWEIVVRAAEQVREFDVFIDREADSSVEYELLLTSSSQPDWTERLSIVFAPAIYPRWKAQATIIVLVDEQKNWPVDAAPTTLLELKQGTLAKQREIKPNVKDE